MATASGRNSGHTDASVAGEQSPLRQRQRREPGKPTWRYLNRLSSSSAWLAPLNRGSLNSAHIHGTDVPVEEPSTASTTDMSIDAATPAPKDRSGVTHPWGLLSVVSTCRRPHLSTSRCALPPFHLGGQKARQDLAGSQCRCSWLIRYMPPSST